MHKSSFISAEYFFPCPAALGNSHSVQPPVSARKTPCTTWLTKLMLQELLLIPECKIKWSTQGCNTSQRMCSCLAPTEFLAFPQKLQAAHYKELNKWELDPEVTSVLQQLVLNTRTHHHTTWWCAIIHLVLQEFLAFDTTFSPPTAMMCPLLHYLMKFFAL